MHKKLVKHNNISGSSLYKNGESPDCSIKN